MSKEDVERLLNSLPDGDMQALQRFFGNKPGQRTEMEKDW